MSYADMWERAGLGFKEQQITIKTVAFCPKKQEKPCRDLPRVMTYVSKFKICISIHKDLSGQLKYIHM